MTRDTYTSGEQSATIQWCDPMQLNKSLLNKPASELLEGFADALEIRGANTFRVRAFRNAARRIDTLTVDINELIESDEIETIPGIGKGIAGVLREFATHGHVEEYELMQSEIPAEVFDMLLIPGLGPKTVATLYNDHDLCTLDELEAAGRENRLANIKAIGPKRQEKLLRELGRFRQRIARRPIGDVLPMADRLVAHIALHPNVEDVQYAGSLRRGQDTIGDLDILASSTDPNPVIQHFLLADDVEEVVGSGDTKTSVLVSNGFQVDLLVIDPAKYGAALAYFTGSKNHNIEIRARAQKRGLSLNEHGFLDVAPGQRRPATTEHAVYETVDLPWIDPALREDRGEIEAAENGKLPDLINIDDVRGELHGHSLWSDGAASIRQMLAAARKRKLEYFAITDHSGSLGVANGLDPKRLSEQTKEIDAERASCTDVHILHGTEVEILPNGTLDFSDKILESLDVVVASVHSNFNQSQAQMTERLITAIENPHVDVIGHPTGRLLGRRDGYQFDVEAVLSASAATGTALEINAAPQRLDIDDLTARRAVELGTPIAINSDAHHPDNLEFLRYGILTARRAWLRPGDVLNTLPLHDLLGWLCQPKPRRWIPR